VLKEWNTKNSLWKLPASAALMEDGQVWTWGNNSSVQLGWEANSFETVPGVAYIFGCSIGKNFDYFLFFGLGLDLIFCFFSCFFFEFRFYRSY
jgi:hypothetical protein